MMCCRRLDQETARRGRPVRLARKVVLARPVQPDPQVPKVRRANRVKLARKVQQARMERKGPRGQTER